MTVLIIIEQERPIGSYPELVRIGVEIEGCQDLNTKNQGKGKLWELQVEEKVGAKIFRPSLPAAVFVWTVVMCSTGEVLNVYLRGH